MAVAIRVLLDSSALRWETATSILLGEVLKACELDLLELHVPEVVIKEVASSLAADTRIPGRTQKEIVRGAAWTGSGDEVEAAVKLLQGFARDAASSIESGIRAHLARVGAKVAPLGASDLHAVLEDYFAGNGMFRNAPRVRDHLPDALIHDLVRQLAESAPPSLVVVTRDRRLTAACEALPGVVDVYSDLRGFIESPWMEVVHQERRAVVANSGLVGLEAVTVE